MKTRIWVGVAFVLMVFQLSAIEVKTSSIYFAQELQFKSAILGQTTSMNIYLPQSFDQASDDHTYPVIFANGGHGSEFFLTLSGVVKHLGELDRMPESIVVSLNDSGFYPDVYTNGMWSSRDKISSYGDPEKYVKHLTDELFPYLAKHYRAADFRMIIGVSGSALFPLYSLTHHPDLFNYHILTTSMDMVGMGFTNGKNMAEHLSKVLIEKPLSKTAFYLGVADDDLLKKPEYTANLELFERVLSPFSPEQFKMKIEVIPNERHYDVYIKALLSAFDFLFPEKRWAQKYRELIALPGDALTNIEQHYQELSKEYGFRVLPKADRWNSVNSLRVISRVVLQDGRTDEAIRLAEQWSHYRPSSPEPLERLSQAYEAKTDLKNAIVHQTRAVQLAQKFEHFGLEDLQERLAALKSQLH